MPLFFAYVRCASPQQHFFYCSASLYSVVIEQFATFIKNMQFLMFKILISATQQLMQMKKLLLMLSAVALSAANVNAQSRLALYEEFTGENCGPCASSNPALDNLVSTNLTKVIKIQYQSPIPSAGPIYNAYKTITDARMKYYSVPFAPYGRLDGRVLGTTMSSPGHVNYLTQADINTDAGTAAKFSMTVSYVWSTYGDSATVTVNVTANSAYTVSGSLPLKLRIGIIQHLQYSTPPGTNGEKDFPNVVREMIPDALGTTMATTWTASQNQAYTIKGKVPTIVDRMILKHAW